ncbi:MAG: FecR domain-containing protein [Bacteroidota bacterium]
MEQAKYITLIHKKLSGQISSTESKHLKQWLEASADNRQLSNEVEQAWKMSTGYREEYMPDVEKGLDRLKQRIEAEQATVRPIAGRSRRLWLIRTAGAAAAIAALLVTAWFFYPGQSDIVWETVANSFNKEQKIQLPDGTILWLNKNSEVDLPSRFSNDKREVRLRGEAFFDVAKDAKRPFIINTQDTEVKVLGTSFNVRAYPEEPLTHLTVQTGSVKFTVNTTGENWVLAPKDSYQYDREDNTIVKGKDDGFQSLAWHTQQLAFEDEPVQKILPAIEELYEASIQLDNPLLANCGLTVTFDHNSLEEVVQIIATSLSMKVVNVSPNSFRLEGGSCE